MVGLLVVRLLVVVVVGWAAGEGGWMSKGGGSAGGAYRDHYIILIAGLLPALTYVLCVCLTLALAPIRVCYKLTIPFLCDT